MTKQTNPPGVRCRALLAGPAGTDKTVAAQVLARELTRPLYRVDLSSIVSKYIGQTEKNLNALFGAAEATGAILMFDEVDAIFGKRTQVRMLTTDIPTSKSAMY